MFWRLKCHSCGARSEYSKGEVESFLCLTCQGWTFVDSNGDYVDPPAQHVSQDAQQYATASSSFPQQGVFCSQCQRNQQIYHELLSDYLPDEDDPKYLQYEASLPAYKQELEERYPQICRRCAPRAQSVIHEADYYSMTTNVSRALRRSVSPAPVCRDTTQKFITRTGLRLVGVCVTASTLYQVLWHAYAVLQMRQEYDDGPAKASDCVLALSRLHFTYPCVLNGASKLPWFLGSSLVTIWYNPGLVQLYDPYVRIASVAGSMQYAIISLMVLLIRAVASVKVIGGGLTHDQTLAVHLGTIAIIIAGHIATQKTIQTEKWRVQGSIMPRPEDRDVLGQFAGPAQEKSTPRASRTSPAELLHRSEPFPISRLAPHRPTVLPSPTSDGDPMDIEIIPPAQQPSIPIAPSWDGVRTNLFGIKDELRAKQQRASEIDEDKHMYIRPFRGRLPAAPLSQEHRLRNPMSQVQFRQPSSGQKQDFLQQMRKDIERGKGYRRKSIESDASEISTAASRTRGQLDLASSGWELPGQDAVLGIEDRFRGARLEDAAPNVPVQQRSAWWILAAIVAVVAVLVLIIGSRLLRPVCLFLVDVLQYMGY